MNSYVQKYFPAKHTQIEIDIFPLFSCITNTALILKLKSIQASNWSLSRTQLESNIFLLKTNELFHVKMTLGAYITNDVEQESKKKNL